MTEPEDNNDRFGKCSIPDFKREEMDFEDERPEPAATKTAFSLRVRAMLNDSAEEVMRNIHAVRRYQGLINNFHKHHVEMPRMS